MSLLSNLSPSFAQQSSPHNKSKHNTPLTLSNPTNNNNINIQHNDTDKFNHDMKHLQATDFQSNLTPTHSTTSHTIQSISSNDEMSDLFGGLSVRNDQIADNSTNDNAQHAHADNNVIPDDHSGFSFMSNDTPSNDIKLNTDESAFNFVTDDVVVNHQQSNDNTISTNDEDTVTDMNSTNDSPVTILHNTVNDTISIFFNQYQSVIELASQASLAIQQLQSQLIQLTQHKTLLESEQLNCIENEEFDMADKLSIDMDQNKSNITQTKTQIQQHQIQLSKATLDKQLILEQLSNQLNQHHHQYTQLCALEPAQSISISDSNKLNELERHSDELSARIERIDKIMVSNQNDLNDASNDICTIESDISGDTAAQVNDKQLLLKDAAQIEIEIDSLQKQLQLKQSELSSVQQQIQSIEDTITQITTNHNRRLTKAKETKQRIIQEIVNAEHTHTTLTQQQNQVQEQINHIKQYHANIASKLNDIGHNISESNDIVQQLMQYKLTAINSIDTQVNDNQSKLDQLNSLISNAHNELNEIELEIVSQQTLLDTCITRLPLLESEKSSAVQARDFKKAAVAATSIKQLQADKVKYMNKLSELQQHASDIQNKLNGNHQQQQQLQLLIDQHQSTIEIEQLQSYKQLYQHIHQLHHNFSTTQHSTTHPVHSCINALSSELVYLKSVIDRLQSKHHTDNDSDLKTNQIDTSTSNSSGAHTIEQVIDDGNDSFPIPSITSSTDPLHDYTMMSKQLDIAIGDEDFDLAAELQDKLTELRNQIDCNATT